MRRRKRKEKVFTRHSEDKSIGRERKGEKEGKGEKREKFASSLVTLCLS